MIYIPAFSDVLVSILIEVSQYYFEPFVLSICFKIFNSNLPKLAINQREDGF